MTHPGTLPPRAALSGLVSGLFLMTFFTVGWVGNTFAAWPAALAWTVLALALVAAAIFVSTAIRLIRSRALFPAGLSDADWHQQRTTGRSFGFVFGAEIAAIWIAVIVLNATGNQDFAVPVIALIVGVHFYPMARIFHRTVDLYLATWTVLVAVAGIVVLAATDAPADQVAALVAVGVAACTATYGGYMTWLARNWLARATSPGRQP
ncbi:hypothetical protein [Actinoplanes sp. N902-109]|uniref:hypothetical protein n=1 Tax=Actinoplanes sp. (strain N902-109) TaxID=649831 RepID=UPI0003296835|nr:hypothetical protein [Actinoplanes sp. N902-109]AGL18498.1 hypothetical protein L083_4988 [Actinoplanes sp. N902-109]